MFVVKEMQLNKHKVVSVPRNKDLYARVGGRIPQQGTSGFRSELGKDKFEVLADSVAAIMDEYQKELNKGKMPLAEK